MKQRSASVLRPLIGVPALLFAACLAGCGDAVVDGSGTLERPRLLVLEGSPYEMGYHHGRVLRSRIRALHGRWQVAAIRGQVGLADDTQVGAAGDLSETMRLFVDQTLHAQALPERVRQEYQGLADATGLTVDELLFTEVMRDGLRIWIKTMEPRLPGVLAAAAGPAGPEGRAIWYGPELDLLEGEWIVVQRRPLDGAASVVLTWPGSVGGIAGLSSHGLAYLLAEAEVDGDFRGFGHGVPFPVGARLAIEAGPDFDRARALLQGTAGHALLMLRAPEDARDVARTAIGSIEVYRGVQAELDFSKKRRSYAIGPWQDVFQAIRRLSLDPGVGDPADVFERMERLLPADARVPLRCRIAWAPDGVHFEVRPSSGATLSLRLAQGAFD